MNYYALIKYDDPEKSEEEKCASEVEDLTPPLFDPKKLYNVFWSPNAKETLKQASKTTGKHKYFPPGSANKGKGFYKARILLLERMYFLKCISNAHVLANLKICNSLFLFFQHLRRSSSLRSTKLAPGS